MAESETGKVNPNPEAAKPAAKPAVGPVDATKYVGTPAVGTSKAAPPAGVAGTAPSTEIDRQRRRFVWTMVTGFPDGVVPGILPILPSAHSLRTQFCFQDRLSVGVRARGRHQVPAEIPHLGGPYAGPSVRDLRALHASGLHARLEAQRKQIQVSMPRQRLRQRRNQLRRTGAASDGPRAPRTRARRTDSGGYFEAVLVAEGTAEQV